MTVICVTGHRPQKLPEDAEARVRAVLRWALTELKPSGLISGMALGVDQWAADEAFALKVPVLAAIPCLGQDRFWSPESQQAYRARLAKVRAQHLITNAPYSPQVMQARNVWMVDQSQTVVAIFDGKPGGTANCVKYAITKRKRVFTYNPHTQESAWLNA